MAHVDKMAEGIYRISPGAWGFPITLNQFLVAGEHPALIHTGTFPCTRTCAGPSGKSSTRRCWSTSSVSTSSRTNAAAWAVSLRKRPRPCSCAAKPGQPSISPAGTTQGRSGVFGTVWDSMMVFEETTKSLFPADLFIQPGDQPAVVKEDLGKEMCHLYREVGIFAAREPVLAVVDRLEKLGAEWIHPMHGGSLPEEVIPHFVWALRQEDFAFEGKIFGRTLPT